MRGSEKQKMLEMVVEMIDYLKENDNQSLIARIYGIFTIKTNVFTPIDFLIMQNTAQSICSKSNNLVFDFKGNTRKRKLEIDNNKHL